MDNVQTIIKTCTKCHITKNCNEFYKHVKSSDGIRTYCKDCSKKYNSENREHLYQKEKEWRKNNPEKVRIMDEKRQPERNRIARDRRKNDVEYKEMCFNSTKIWKEKNRNKVNEYKRNYRQLHLEEVRKKEKQRIDTNINFKLGIRLRSRIKNALKDNKKNGSAVKDLGCTLGELKQYLESKFQPGMTWENYGYRGWHIDHIIPLSKVDLTNREQFLKACHYTNLQPLWAFENMSKGNRI